MLAAGQNLDGTALLFQIQFGPFNKTGLGEVCKGGHLYLAFNAMGTGNLTDIYHILRGKFLTGQHFNSHITAPFLL